MEKQWDYFDLAFNSSISQLNKNNISLNKFENFVEKKLYFLTSRQKEMFLKMILILKNDNNLEFIYKMLPFLAEEQFLQLISDIFKTEIPFLKKEGDVPLELLLELFLEKEEYNLEPLKNLPLSDRFKVIVCLTQALNFKNDFPNEFSNYVLYQYSILAKESFLNIQHTLLGKLTNFEYQKKLELFYTEVEEDALLKEATFIYLKSNPSIEKIEPFLDSIYEIKNSVINLLEFTYKKIGVL